MDFTCLSLKAKLARGLMPALGVALLMQSVPAQTPTASISRNVQSEVERENPRVQKIIERAEVFYNEGTNHLRRNERAQARQKFDKAIDTILESGMDVRGNPKLQRYYLEKVESIYRLEVGLAQAEAPAANTAANALAANTTAEAQVVAAVQQDQTQTGKQQPPPIGFADQSFEPSPLDELSKLKLTSKEEQVTTTDIAELEVAKQAVNFGFQVHPLVQQYINYYQGRGRGTMVSGLQNSGRFMKMAKRIFREEGVPEDIAWLGQVESAWKPRAQSWAAASGLWQFIPGTGARFGLRQTAWVDERNSYEKATRASARYLKWLANRYNGNWELAMGAYNTGEGNIDRAIRRAGSQDFWKIYPYIAQETRNYVPNILATILIAKNPRKYGFAGIKTATALAYDEVKVPSATSLSLVANLTGSSVDYVRALNPELKRDMTPAGEPWVLRVPPGRSRQFVAALRDIPMTARGGGNVQQVVKTYVRAGQATPTGARLISVRARAGETIASISTRLAVSPDEVARINGIPATQSLNAGQEINVPSTGAAPRAARRR